MQVYSYSFPDPYILEKKDWKTDLASWPKVEFGDVYVYLKSCSNNAFDEESLKDYKSLSAYEYVTSGEYVFIVLKNLLTWM